MTNPKERYGAQKPALHLLPPSALALVALVMEDGGRKYGPYNWRESAVCATTYVSAAKRHLDAWLDGEAYTSDSGLPNLAAVAACALILLDAQLSDKLIDDRPLAGAASVVHDAAKAWKAGEHASLREALTAYGVAL